MGYSAFQSNAFQRNAFQIQGEGTPPTPETPIIGGGRVSEYWIGPRKKYLEDRIEALPEPVQEVMEQALNVEDKRKREELLRQGLDTHNKFLRVYIALLEEYYALMIEQQIAEELQRIQKARDDEDDLLILLFMSV